MAVPCTIVDSGGVPVTESAHGSPFTPTINAFPVTIVADGGIPVVFVDVDGTLMPGGGGEELPALSLPFSTMTSLADLTAKGVTYSGTSLATMYDSTGKLTYKPNNLLLNSATLSTQDVTTNGVAPYILSFKGTGSVTLTGTSTAGPLVGTGASDRVYLKITPTAGTLTLTVSGTVTEAQLEAVTYQTSPRPYVATTSAAHYGPRFDYDPVTLVAKGLLVEEARTNAETTSGTIANMSLVTAGGMQPIGSGSTADVATAPDGTQSAGFIAEYTNSGLHYTFGSTYTDAQTRTYSVFLKAGSRSKARIQIGAAFMGSGVYADVDLSAGTIGVATAVGTDFAVVRQSGIQDFGNGWYRCSVSATTPASTHVGYISLTSDAGVRSYVGDGVSGLYVWGRQMELGSHATSYIPTSSAAVSRVADSVSMTGTAFSDFYNATEGTFVVEYSTYYPAASSGRIFGVSDGTTNERIIAFLNNRVATALIGDGGATQAAIATGPALANVPMKFALAYAANDIAAVADGGTVGTDAAATLPTPNRLQFFSLETGFPGNAVSGHVKSLTYYNVRKSDAELITLTEAA